MAAAVATPGSPDDTWVEVVHTSSCKATRCGERGLWFYLARGCSDMLWNVGRSLRALNKLHALTLLTGRSRICRTIASLIGKDRTLGLSAAKLRARGVPGSRRLWLRGVLLEEGCNGFVDSFGTHKYANLSLLELRRLDPFQVVGASLFDAEIMRMARAQGFDSVQLLMQPGGGPNGLNALETEFFDIRETRHVCDIEKDPAALLRYLRTASGAPCRPTRSFSSCMACKSGNTSARDPCNIDCEISMDGGLHGTPVPCKSVPEANRTQARLRALSGRGRRAAEIALADAAWITNAVNRVLWPRNLTRAREWVSELQLAMGGCPMSRAEVQHPLLDFRKRLVRAGRTPTPCRVLRAISTDTSQLPWPLNATACAVDAGGDGV